jgi:hypothetical protein
VVRRQTAAARPVLHHHRRRWRGIRGELMRQIEQCHIPTNPMPQL